MCHNEPVWPATLCHGWSTAVEPVASELLAPNDTGKRRDWRHWCCASSWSCHHAGSESGQARYYRQKCFFQLRQLRRVRRSLDDESVATLVHAFVISRIDYCNGLLAGAPKVVTDKLQRVMNSAAHVITNTWKFDHGLSHVQHEILHWLDVPERVTFKLYLSVYKCLHGMGPLNNSLFLVTDSRQLAEGHSLLLARQHGTVCRCTWMITLSLDSFKRFLKSFLFQMYW